MASGNNKRPARAPLKDPPHIVVIGGGTGSHNVLLGLKHYNCQITTVVNMSDSGGSSGRLRDELGQLPPGDARQCLVALIPDERSTKVLRDLFNYRFSAGEGLKGHSFGNLFLAALADITGNMATAIEEASRLLNTRGIVLPVTLTDTTLKARLSDGTEIVGEANIDHRSVKPELPIDYVYLEPKAYAYGPVLDAIDTADAIVLGPGDLYSSIIPNLLVEDVPGAIRASHAVKIFICNLMTKPGESDDFKASDFVKTLTEYLGEPSIDYLVVNNTEIPQRLAQRYESFGQHPVEVDLDECQQLVPHLVQAPLLHTGVYIRHNAEVLGKVLMDVVPRVVKRSHSIPVEQAKRD